MSARRSNPPSPGRFALEELANCVRCGEERPVGDFKRDACGYGYCKECWPKDPLDRTPLLTMSAENPDELVILGRRYHIEFFRQLEDVTPPDRALRVVKNARGQTSIDRFDLCGRCAWNEGA